MFATLFQGLLPKGVALAWERSDTPCGALFPEEQALVARAVEKRRREFAQGRACARRVLGELGFAPAPLLAGEMREPLWPAGVVGSISHDRVLCAAIVARRADFAGVGIDVEPDEPLDESVAARIWSPEEAASALASGVVPLASAAKLVFSAKEAVYKCQFALTQTFIGFGAVELRLGDGSFEATLTADVGALARGFSFAGAWRRAANEIATSAWVPS
jgi:4'-phosphopantetheinyl transferase EntD